jgi:hypothetical protein
MGQSMFLLCLVRANLASLLSRDPMLRAILSVPGPQRALIPVTRPDFVYCDSSVTVVRIGEPPQVRRGEGGAPYAAQEVRIDASGQPQSVTLADSTGQILNDDVPRFLAPYSSNRARSANPCQEMKP